MATKVPCVDGGVNKLYAWCPRPPFFNGWEKGASVCPRTNERVVSVHAMVFAWTDMRLLVCPPNHRYYTTHYALPLRPHTYSAVVEWVSPWNKCH